MVTLDLRNIVEMYIRIVPDEPWYFALGIKSANLDLTGATATMQITGQENRTLTIGAGLTIISPTKIAISSASLPIGIYNYTLKITTITGVVVRFIHKINSSK